MKTLIKNGMVCTMKEQCDAFKGDVLVEDGKILKVDTQIEEENAEVIDATGLYVMPGLVDAHTHIGVFDFNHESSVDDANEMTDPVVLDLDVRYSIDPKAREFKVSYEHGITTLLVTPGSGEVFCGLPAAVKTYGDNVFDMTLKAPCAVKIALGGNPKNTFGGMSRYPMTRMGVADVLRDTFRRAKEYLDKKTRGEEPTYDSQLEALSRALTGELPCKVHCTQYDMLTAIEVCNEYGVRFSIEHAWGATDYIDELVESGCDICYGPIATYRCTGERRKIDIEAVKELDERGVNVAIVTDSPILSEESLYHHIGEAVREGVPQERALRMVTINAAKSMGVDDRIGTLEAGKDADIILVKGRLGLDTDAKVQCTMIDGKVVYQNA